MTPVPRLMRTLERDARGYPIPFVVLRDKQDKPIFTINDFRLVGECVRKKLCSICGKKLLVDAWFVSGSRAFLHPHGAFADPPVHLDCAEYALQECPFLAMASWKPLGPRMAHNAKDRLPIGLRPVEIAHVGPTLPEWFGLGQAQSMSVSDKGNGEYRFSVGDWRYLEFWKAGRPVPAPSAAEVTELLKLT